MSMVLELAANRRAPDPMPKLRVVFKLSEQTDSTILRAHGAFAAAAHTQAAAHTANSDALRAEFEALAMPHSGVLYAMAYRLCGKAAQAEDLVQDAYVTAWRRFNEFQRGTNFKAWIFQILVFHHMNARRAKKNDAVSIETTGHAATATVSENTGGAAEAWSDPYADKVDDVFKRALDRLDDAHRSVMLMVALGELSYQECAEALQVPVGTVMSRLFRARKQLQEELADYAKDRGYVGRGGQAGRKGAGL